MNLVSERIEIMKRKKRENIRQKGNILFCILVYIFLFLPILVIVVNSFNATTSKPYLSWKGFTFGWYAELFTNTDLLGAFGNTLILAGISTLLATNQVYRILYAHINGWHHNALSYFRDRQRFDDIQYTLSTVPRDKAVLTFHSYTVALRSVPELYDVFYHNEQQYDDKIDIIVVPRSITENTDSKEHEVINRYLEQGYKEGAQSTKQVLILEKPNP